MTRPASTTAGRRLSDVGRAAGDDRSTEFSLVEGGPLHRLYLQCRLLREPTGLLGRRIAVLVLVAWLPILLLSAAAGTATGGVRVPFLGCLGVHARLLLALPLLIAAEVLVHDRLKTLVTQFTAEGIVPPEGRARFEATLASSRRLCRAALPEILLILLAFTGGHWVWSRHVALPMDTWYGNYENGQRMFSPAGYWYAFVSLPLFRFVLYRWYYRLAIWYRFLWRVSRQPLVLNPLHPDRAAGIGFLSDSVQPFAPILIAHSALLAGVIGDQIWHEGAVLPQFKIEIASVAGALILVAIVPLFFFTIRLERARRAALREYEVFAADYVREFRSRWTEAAAAPPSSPLGSPDIQSLADLGVSFDVARGTRLLPVGKRTLVIQALLIALPFLPLMLTMMPLEKIVTQLARLFL